MKTLGFQDVGAQIELIGPPLDPAKTTVFSIFRDEMYFLPAFFDHYRRLGVTQFVIVDDKSEDGTTQWLDAQPDCIRISSALRYGSEISVRTPDGRRRDLRAGIYFKGAIPRHLMPGRFVTYVDADEFMLLPPGVDGLPALERRLEQDGDVAAVASLVEFFPEDASGFGMLDAPHCLEDLLAASPFFEAKPLLRLVPGARKPEFVAQSKSFELMQAYGIEALPPARRTLWQRITGKAAAQEGRFLQSPRHKTPVVRHSDKVHMVGTHNINLPPSATVMPTIAHFVYTPQFGAKVERAIGWGSHVHGASKYHFYAQLLERMRAGDGGFRGPQTRRYEGPGQLLEAGLMRW